MYIKEIVFRTKFIFILINSYGNDLSVSAIAENPVFDLYVVE